ncbi:MAG: type II secretion system protein [Patescibacteria group bacterium]
MSRISHEKGYTLIETLVALGLFMVVVFIAITALFVVADANKRAQATRRIVDNLDFTIEEVVRSARKGRAYNCGSATDLTAQIAAGNDGIGSPRNCDAGTYIAFEDEAGDVTLPNDQIIYRLDIDLDHVEKSTDGGGSWLRLTEPGVTINDLKFYVTGSGSRDEVHAKILFILRAQTQAVGLETTIFNIQTTVTQRATDL